MSSEVARNTSYCNSITVKRAAATNTKQQGRKMKTAIVLSFMCSALLTFFTMLRAINFAEFSSLIGDASTSITMMSASASINIFNNQEQQLALRAPPSSTCSEVAGTLTFRDENNPAQPKLLPHYFPFKDLLRGLDRLDTALAQAETKPNQTITAVCVYHRCPMHHPHFMQEIMRCFSFWKSRQGQAPVLYVPRHQFSQFMTKPTAFHKRFPISAGLLNGLKRGINLTVTNAKRTLTVDNPGVYTSLFMGPDNVSSFAMHSRDYAMALKDIYVPKKQQQPQFAQPTQTTITATPPPLRIGIYNRYPESGRSMLNIDAVYHTLQQAFPSDIVQLKYFPEKSRNKTVFQDEVDFFTILDVLVSSHGHQMLGIMFMSPCSAVLELFPYKYYLPGYFSSLANLMNVLHTNWYVSDTPVPTDLEMDIYTRLNNTRNNMCPALDGLVCGVQQLLERRRKCLLSLSNFSL